MIIEYCNDIRKLEVKSKENLCLDSIDNELWDESLYSPLIGDEDNLNDVTQNSLYHLIGALLCKIKKNFKHCDKCFNVFFVDCQDDANNNVSYYTKLRQYKDNVLFFPTTDVFNIMYKCELSFRKNEKKILSNSLSTIEFVDAFLSNNPSCHNIMRKLIKTFVTARIHFSLKKDHMNKANANSSRSVAMKLSVANVKCYTNKRK